MTTFQIIMLVLAILATIYELIKIAQVVIYMRKYIYVQLKPGFFIGMIIAVLIQVICLSAFVGVK